MRVSSRVTAFDTGSLDEVFGIVDVDSPGLGGVFAFVAGIGCGAANGALGRWSVIIVCLD